MSFRRTLARLGAGSALPFFFLGAGVPAAHAGNVTVTFSFTAIENRAITVNGEAAVVGARYMPDDVVVVAPTERGAGSFTLTRHLDAFAQARASALLTDSLELRDLWQAPGMRPTRSAPRPELGYERQQAIWTGEVGRQQAIWTGEIETQQAPASAAASSGSAASPRIGLGRPTGARLRPSSGRRPGGYGRQQAIWTGEELSR